MTWKQLQSLTVGSRIQIIFRATTQPQFGVILTKIDDPELEAVAFGVDMDDGSHRVLIVPNADFEICLA